jgi:hypothetical protein
MLCSAIANSTYDRTTRTTAPGSKTGTTPPSGSGYPTSAPFGSGTSTGIPGPEPGLPSAKTSQPHAHLLLNKGRGTKVFFTVLFRTLDSFFIFTFSFFYFSIFFILCLQCLRILHYLYSFTFLHFIISPSTLTISKRKQPRRKGEISCLIF